MARVIDIKILVDRFNESIEKIELSLNDFEKILNHPLTYLEDYIFDVKNKVDIQREELIQEIHRASNQIIVKIDKYHQDCIENVTKLNKLTASNKDMLSKLKVELNDEKTKVENNDVSLSLISEYLYGINNNLRENKKKCFEYEDSLKMNTIYSFIPNKFVSSNDLFGVLNTKSSNELDFSVIKAFSISEEYFDIIDDTKMAVVYKFKNYISYNHPHDYLSIRKLYSSGNIQSIKVKGINALKWISKSLLAIGRDNESIEILDLDKNGECCQTLIGHQSDVTCLYFYENKNHLISVSLDGQIRVWNLNNNECIHVLDGCSSTNLDIRINNSIGFLFNYSHHIGVGTIKIWNSNEDYKLERVIKRDNITYIDFTPNGNIAICRNEKPYAIEIVDFLTGKSLHFIDDYYLCSSKNDIQSIKCFKFISESLLVVFTYDKISLVDLNTDKIIHNNFFKFKSKQAKLMCLKNGDLLVSYRDLYDSYGQFTNPKTDYKIKIIRFNLC